MTIEIKQNDWEHVPIPDYPEHVEVVNLDSSVGVLIYSPNTGDIYGAHLPVARHALALPKLAVMLATANRILAGVPNVEVWVRGCCDPTDAAQGHAPARVRAYLEAKVRKVFPQADVRWPEPGVRSLDMVLDLEAREFGIVEHR